MSVDERSLTVSLPVADARVLVESLDWNREAPELAGAADRTGDALACVLMRAELAEKGPRGSTAVTIARNVGDVVVARDAAGNLGLWERTETGSLDCRLMEHEVHPLVWQRATAGAPVERDWRRTTQDADRIPVDEVHEHRRAFCNSLGVIADELDKMTGRWEDADLPPDFLTHAELPFDDSLDDLAAEVRAAVELLEESLV